MIHRDRQFLYGVPPETLALSDILNQFGMMLSLKSGELARAVPIKGNGYCIIEDTPEEWRLIPLLYLNSKTPRFDFLRPFIIPK